MQARIWVSAALVGLAALAAPAQAADVGVSIGISQPGVYGRIDIGRFPQPQVIVQQPVIIQQQYYRQPVQPVYLWVPPGHQQNWARYCGRYNACGAPVYFVQDRWYREQGPGRRWEDGRRNDREERWDERHDKHWDKHRDKHWDKHRDKHGDDEDRGNGRGRGRGHDRG